MDEYLFGDFLSLADVKEIEDEKNVMKEIKKSLREIALSATKLAEDRRTRMSLPNKQPVKIINVEKCAQKCKNNDLLKNMKRLRIEEHLNKQSIVAGCYKEKNKPPPMHEFKSFNRQTHGSPIRYTLEELKAIGAYKVVEVKPNPEQMEFKNEDESYIGMSLTESLNQPTDGSPVKYTVEELKANGASNVVQVKENPEQMEFKNEDKTKNIE